jgi:hypothetical protein
VVVVVTTPAAASAARSKQPAQNPVLGTMSAHFPEVFDTIAAYEKLGCTARTMESAESKLKLRGTPWE